MKISEIRCSLVPGSTTREKYFLAMGTSIVKNIDSLKGLDKDHRASKYICIGMYGLWVWGEHGNPNKPTQPDHARLEEGVLLCKFTLINRPGTMKFERLIAQVFEKCPGLAQLRRGADLETAFGFGGFQGMVSTCPHNGRLYSYHPTNLPMTCWGMAGESESDSSMLAASPSRNGRARQLEFSVGMYLSAASEFTTSAGLHHQKMLTAKKFLVRI